MKNRRCRLVFRTYGKFVLDTFANGVKVGVFSNPTVFVNLSVTESNFSILLSNYNIATADYDILGKTKRTTYLVAKENLIKALDQLANDVNVIAAGDASLILLAGFSPTTATNFRNDSVSKIQEVIVKTTMVSGQISVETNAIDNSGPIFYGTICSEGAPLGHTDFIEGQISIKADGPRIIMDLNKSRKKIIFGCTPGAQYYVYMFAVNAVGVSPLSDPRTVWAN
ncbi:hypothetical protein OX284_003240 [Flavobacterium sp. SUN046]|uniref:hypothetical protein n=1 Tax=Flavobacterium sp. SUN046 TaxID=3002440 RepID=UPI002DBAC398|nr:hypothetical protein [Flavobacterium sp. SUN046]MEC4048432.1 hypothetical protein [Flavobacterium sp. SUN046]